MGTAPRGFVWVLIEYDGGWPTNGYDGLDIDPQTKTLVYAAAQQARARMLLIRRHGRRTRSGPRRWAVLHHEGPGGYRQQWGTWRREEDLGEIATALSAPGELGHPPVILVCTHGQHDVCCAVRGRPVAQALDQRWPELVWECTHVGGDRFAATVVVAPDGVYYGGLDAPSAVAAVEQHLAGLIHAEHLRGYTDLYPAQQAAVTAMLQRLGPAGRHDYRVGETHRDGDHWSIHVTGPSADPASYAVDLQAHRTPPLQLTCRGPAASSATFFELLSVEEATA